MGDPFAERRFYVLAPSLIKAAPRNLLRGLGQMLFPPTCLGCQAHVAQPGSLCGSCWPGLRLVERPFCPVMGIPFREDMGERFLSAEAIASPPPFDRARCVAVHAGIGRRMVGDLKYRDRLDLAPWMARWMARAGAELLRDADVIVPVPLHRRRFFQRRYNQSAELARALSRVSGIPFDPDLVTRPRSTRQQVGLGAKQRQDNVRGAFKVGAAARRSVEGKRMLVVDDVYTTGATVTAVARALKRSGAAGIDILTFSRVLPDDFSLEDLEP